MFQKLSKKLRKKQGFTLIELIVVLAILGIILAIAVPNYLGVQAGAAASADGRTLQLVEDSVKLWYFQEKPTASSDFVKLSAAGGADSNIGNYVESTDPRPSSSTLGDTYFVYVSYTDTDVQAVWATEAAITDSAVPGTAVVVTAEECTDGDGITDAEKEDA